MSVVSFLHLAQGFPDHFLPYLQFETPRQLIAKAPDIARTLDVFADEKSRRQFVALIVSACNSPSTPCLMTPAAIILPPSSSRRCRKTPTFVDCGAYDGDTIRMFLQRQRDFREIVAFEPDPENYRRLQACVDALPPAIGRRITTHCKGVGERQERVAFSATGNMGAAFDNAGDCMVETVALRDVIPAERRSIFIKFDVEGAEQAALAEDLIREAAPSLAVSVYHRPEDIWKIPSDLRAMNSDYRLFLRTLGCDGMDVICYAVPQHGVRSDHDAPALVP